MISSGLMKAVVDDAVGIDVGVDVGPAVGAAVGMPWVLMCGL